MSVSEVSSTGFEVGCAYGNTVSLEARSELAGLALHEVIHAPSAHRFFYPTYEFHAGITSPATNIVQKVSQISANQSIVPKLDARNSDAGGSVEGGAKYTWDGNGGGSWSGYVEGEVHDGEGNSAHGRITQNSDGSGSAEAWGESDW